MNEQKLHVHRLLEEQGAPVSFFQSVEKIGSFSECDTLLLAVHQIFSLLASRIVSKMQTGHDILWIIETIRYPFDLGLFFDYFVTSHATYIPANYFQLNLPRKRLDSCQLENEQLSEEKKRLLARLVNLVLFKRRSHTNWKVFPHFILVRPSTHYPNKLKHWNSDQTLIFVWRTTFLGNWESRGEENSWEIQ